MATLAAPEQQLVPLEGVHTLLRGLWGQSDAFLLLTEAGPRKPEFEFVLCDLGQDTSSLCASHSPSVRAKSLQSRPTLCDPMDCSPPGSSVRGTLQARILERVVMPSSRGSSRPRD